MGFAAPRQRFGAGPLDGEGDVRGDQRRELQLLVGEGSRLVQVDHELADEAAQADQRDERHPGDPFGLDRRQERRQRRVLRDVRDDDRLRLDRVGRPRTVALDRLAVGVRQAAPGGEAHDAAGVEEQDRRARHPEAPRQRVEGRLVDLVDGPGPADRQRQAVTHRYRMGR